MAYSRLEHQGGAIIAALNADITSGDTSLTLVAATNWPTGTNPFYLVVDVGTSAEEKILATARSGATLTGLTRGVDGTTAAAHSAGAVVEHIFTAAEADEANITANKTIGAIAAKGDLLVGTASQTLGVLTAGTNLLPLVANSAQTTGLQYAALTSTGLGTASVTSTQLATDSVTNVKVANNAIDTAELVDSSVTTAKINNNAVTAAKIGSLPRCVVRNSIGLVISDATNTAVTFDTEVVDTDTMHDTGSNTSRITFTTAGFYLLVGNVNFGTDGGTGICRLQIKLNGGSTVLAAVQTPTTAQAVTLQITKMSPFSAADYVELFAFHDGGGLGVTLAASNPSTPSFSACFLS